MKLYRIAFLLLILSALHIAGCRKKPDDDPKKCKDCIVVYKPNIYIYPKQTLSLSVALDFPKGGRVVESIPLYGAGWNVTVTPEGKINGQYDYLFYESEQPDEWQYKTGWTVAKDSLEIFFKSNLAAYHFKINEIKDFIDYWVPLLKDHDYYHIYPQERPVIEELIKVRFSSAPENFLRLFYVVKGTDTPSPLKPHVIRNTVPRTGYHAAEWGVVL
ncbi:hypothetical protein U0035_07045 [Niabella yanshanensis]|uniref:DUF2931 family protein n=1 Tax=Niabella yanshanensis TaxID=577386 RepID=A0ABZ0W9E2_9BACT|nr:hypothetical protein [Niabella yanshanensis]WQD39905.1 hypothetical protein U0035_07045 [Niabella yanshanensis]